MNTSHGASLQWAENYDHPLDIKLIAILELNDESNSILYKYLQNVSSDAEFTTSVAQVLVEEQQEAHIQQWNQGKIQPTFEIGYVVKVYVQVQSNSEQVDVEKSHIKHGEHSKLRKYLGTIPTKSKYTTNMIQLFVNTKSEIS